MFDIHLNHLDKILAQPPRPPRRWVQHLITAFFWTFILAALACATLALFYPATMTVNPDFMNILLLMVAWWVVFNGLHTVEAWQELQVQHHLQHTGQLKTAKDLMNSHWLNPYLNGLQGGLFVMMLASSLYLILFPSALSSFNQFWLGTFTCLCAAVALALYRRTREWQYCGLKQFHRFSRQLKQIPFQRELS